MLILGGGVNGAGLLRELALQGVRCILVDKDDYAAGASSKSSRMIHGGLRYLENAEFKLVQRGDSRAQPAAEVCAALRGPVADHDSDHLVVRRPGQIAAGLFRVAGDARRTRCCDRQARPVLLRFDHRHEPSDAAPFLSVEGQVIGRDSRTQERDRLHGNLLGRVDQPARTSVRRHGPRGLPRDAGVCRAELRIGGEGGPRPRSVARSDQRSRRWPSGRRWS